MTSVNRSQHNLKMNAKPGRAWPRRRWQGKDKNGKTVDFRSHRPLHELHNHPKVKRLGLTEIQIVGNPNGVGPF